MAAIDKHVSSMSADELWGTITGSLGRVSHEQHAHCRQCHGCIFDFVCSNCGTVNPYGVVGGNISVANLCPYCSSPVTNGQIDDGDAFPIDECGPDDGKYAHRECTQERSMATTDSLCECNVADCAPHRIYGVLCSACTDGEHRKEGEIGTATFRKELEDALRSSIEQGLSRRAQGARYEP